MPWYVFALLTPALYSVTNYIEKYLIDKKIKSPIGLLVISGFISLVVGTVIFVFSGFPTFDFVSTILILLAGIFLKLYLIPYFFALQIEDASRVVPLFQLVPIFVLTLAWTFLGEALSTHQVAGAAIVVVGGMLLGVERGSGKKFKLRKAYWYMILASLMYASILVLIRGAVKDYAIWDVLAYEYLGAGVAGISLLLVPSIRKSLFQEKADVKSIVGYLFLNDSLAIAAQFAETVAISMVAVAYVSIIGGVQPFILLIYGLVLSLWFPKIIKEDISRETLGLKLAAILLILPGLYLVYF